MADNLQATPRNELLGLLSDAMYGGLDWMKDPRRSQQMQGLAGLLESTGIPQTTQRVAYGEPLTNIGRANVPLLKPETAEALMNVAPFAPAVGRLASRAVKATEGLPVGMSIKPINLSKGIYKPELTMEEMLKVKDIPTVERVRKSIDLVGEKEFEKMVNAQYKKYKPVDQDQEAMLVESVTLDILGRAQRSPYPQQAALDLAQQRAALPVSEGGLGLLAGNTPEMRAQAMGFDTPVYHATDVDFTSINPSVKGKYGAGVYTATTPKYAEIYAQGENARTLPLMARGKLASDDERIAIADQMLEQYQAKEGMDVPLWKKMTKEELANRGYTGVSIGKERLIFNPSDLRSRFAAFDPFRKDVATATAMGVALPDLLAAEPTPQPQSSGLLYPFP
jgi:hypothetical protein